MLAGQSGLEPPSHSRYATELQDCRLCDTSQLDRADPWQTHTMYYLGWPCLYSRPSITGRHKSSSDKPVRACAQESVRALLLHYLPACDG